MTDEQRYMELLKAVGELLHEKDYEIRMMNYQIENLKHTLSDTERKLEELKKGIQDE